MIELTDLTKRYAGAPAVDGLSLTVESGELVFLVGGSGCGKTTTLKMVNRLVEPTSGSVRVAGREVSGEEPHALRRRIGYVFQGIGLFPHLTVAENVGITPSLLGWPRARIEARVRELLELVRLAPDDFGHRRPAELSGGQQQRVALARALAARPAILLLDEPFGALDPLTRDRLQRAFARIRRELRLTGIFVSHDMAEALLLADRIGVMRRGRLLQLGTPAELVRRPADGYVERLMAAPKRQAEILARAAGVSPDRGR